MIRLPIGSESLQRRATRCPATHVLTRHDGRWIRAQLLEPVPPPGSLADASSPLTTRRANLTGAQHSPAAASITSTLDS